MTLHPPFEISPRLLPALRVGGAWLSLDLDGWTNNRRMRFRWYVDLPDGTEASGNDLCSGVSGCDLQEAFESLLAFLGACAQSWPDGENVDLFPPAVAEWASQNSDELAMLQCEIEETADLIC